jgi:hypothetical protein
MEVLPQYNSRPQTRDSVFSSIRKMARVKSAAVIKKDILNSEYKGMSLKDVAMSYNKSNNDDFGIKGYKIPK